MIVEDESEVLSSAIASRKSFLSRAKEYLGSEEHGGQEMEDIRYDAIEFENLIMSATECLGDEGDAKQFLNYLITIGRILEAHPSSVGFFLCSQLSLKLSDLGNPVVTDPKVFLVISDILTNLTSISEGEGAESKFLPSYSDSRLIQPVKFRRKDEPQDFYSSHMEFFARNYTDIFYVKAITPVLYNITSENDINSLIDISLIGVFLDIFDASSKDIGFYLSLVLINVFRRTIFKSQEIASKLLYVCKKYIPMNEHSYSLNLCWCLYYFCLTSPLILLIGQDFFELLNSMIHMEDAGYYGTAYSILSYASFCDESQIIENFLSSFDIRLILDHSLSFDHDLSLYSINCLLNMSAKYESIFAAALENDAVSIALNIAVESQYRNKIQASIFICLAISKSDEIKHFFTNEENISILSDVSFIPELSDLLLETISSILDAFPECAELVANSVLYQQIDDYHGISEQSSHFLEHFRNFVISMQGH